jgi:hypothetical protein
MSYQRLNIHDVLQRATVDGKLITDKLSDDEVRYLVDAANYLQKVVRKAGRNL